MAPTLLVFNPAAGSANDEARRRLEEALGEVRVVELDRFAAEVARLPAPARVVVAGGDGTVGAVARALVGTRHVLGIVPLGTFNNFARGLGIPMSLDGAIAVIEGGVTASCSVGRLGEATFLEAALVGTLARSIEVGEVLKELEFGELPAVLARHAGSGRFRYRISGDVKLSGWASSIIVANTPSTGALIPTGGERPTDPELDLRIAPPAARGALVRLLRWALLRRRPKELARRIRRIHIETDPDLPAVADASPAGHTPIPVESVPGALRVLVPRTVDC